MLQKAEIRRILEKTPELDAFFASWELKKS